MIRIISALLLASAATLAQAEATPALVSNPPQQHVVAPGDTLWGISAKFLREPWRWPAMCWPPKPTPF